VDPEFQSVILSDKKFMESSNKLLDFDNQEKNNYISYIKEKSTYFGKRSIEYYKDEVCKELTKTVFENVKEIAVELIQILLKNLKGKIQQIGEKIQERKEKKEQERKKKEDEMLRASIIAYEQRNIQRNLEREKRIKEQERKKKEKPIIKQVKQNSNFPNKNDSNKIINPNPPTDSIKDTNTYPNLSTVKIEQKQKEIKKEEAKKEIQPVSNVSNSTSGSFCFSTEFSEGYDEEDQELIDRYESDKICKKLDEDLNRKNAQENKSSINIENKNQIHEEKSCLNPGNENFMETWKKDSNEVTEQIEKEDEEKKKKIFILWYSK
jgi:E3 ubiquitin-protein ligase DOA10